MNKDQQKRELKQRPNQKQESRVKGKHLKEQKQKQEQEQKQEKFTDQPIRPDKMTQTSIKQTTKDINSSRTQNHKEEEGDDENKSSCVIS